METVRINKISRSLGSSFALLIVLQVMVAVLFLLLDSNPKRQQAQMGTLDLRAWDFYRDGSVKLDGQWAFYWERQLAFADLRSDPPLQPDKFAKVPGKWNGYPIKGDLISGYGYATYKLTILIKEAGKPLALKLMPQSSAYRIYADDRLLVSSGEAGTSKEAFRADYKPQTVEFIPAGQSFALLVQIANFEYVKGGMSRTILLGSPEDIHAFDRKLIFKDLFLLGCLAIACFYSLSMFFMNREQKLNLYFALVCFIFVCRISISSSYYIYELFPAVSVNVIEWINYVTFHGGILAYALMIREFFPAAFSNRVRKALIVLTGTILGLLLIFPLGVYSRFYLVSDIAGLAALGYGYYVTVKAALARLLDSWLVFFGNGLLLTFVILDIVFTELNKSDVLGYFSNYGFFVFIFEYAFILARRFSVSYREEKSFTRKLLELDKLKDEFLANTSHELKTPLQGIVSITESLIAGAEGQLNNGQVKNLNMVADSGRRLTNLINDILDISKLKYGEIELSRQNVQIQPLVEFILQVCKLMYPHKSVAWSHRIPQELSPVFADENRLVQILFNLIGNAAKFTDNGEVSVTAEEHAGEVKISITDTGIGIRQEQIEVIFQAFAQADASITRRYGGVGLGLSITKYLVELHDGRLEASSAPGEGSRFTVTLPAGDRAATEGNGVPTYPMPPINENEQLVAADQVYHFVQSGEHVLVVDDAPSNLQSSVNLLKLEGYTVTAAASGRRALEVLRQKSDIQLVILDVMMPELSGYELCRIIRETKPFYELPILMVTAKHQPEELVLGFRAGANDYLVKPFEPLEFNARVRTLIELKKTMNQALRSEVAFLQAQIKPHFIYNTLNTISYFCTRDGAKANEILEHFSAYLRSSFDFKSSDASVTVAKELEFVTAYLEIEKARFGDRLQTIFEVEKEVLRMQIPRLIVQPLVENAIIHGIMKKIAGGLVRVTIKRQGSDLAFSVSDTGEGMTADKLAKLFSDQAERGVGLRNIHKRLHNLYGREMHISSVEGRGTEIEFAVPASEGGAR